MSTYWRFLAAILVIAATWPEFPRYRAERDLAEAGRQINQVMRGVVQGLDAVAAAQQAETLSRDAARWLPGDARPPLHRAVALMLLARTNEAIAVLESAIRAGERPELTLNLGRARFQSGDRQGADRAYLRAAWAAPAVLKTLPMPMRTALLDEVERLDVELREGRSTRPPALD